MNALKRARKHAKAGRWKAAQAWALIAMAETESAALDGNKALESAQQMLSDARQILDRAQRLYERTPPSDDPRLWVLTSMGGSDRS